MTVVMINLLPSSTVNYQEYRDKEDKVYSRILRVEDNDFFIVSGFMVFRKMRQFVSDRVCQLFLPAL